MRAEEQEQEQEAAVHLLEEGRKISSSMLLWPDATAPSIRDSRPALSSN